MTTLVHAGGSGTRVRRIVVKICYPDNAYNRIFGLYAIRLTGYSKEDMT